MGTGATYYDFFAWAAGSAISSANDCATWIQALVTGHLFDAEYQQLWLNSLRPEDPKKPDGQAYGYGIIRLRCGTNAMYYHGGETAGTIHSWATTPPIR